MQNYENENFATTLLLHNLLYATHPPLPSAKRFFNAARQCYFDLKTNKEPCFSILSIIILCIQGCGTGSACTIPLGSGSRSEKLKNNNRKCKEICNNSKFKVNLDHVVRFFTFEQSFCIFSIIPVENSS